MLSTAKLRYFLNRPIGRYLIVGVSVYLFELAVIFVGQTFFSAGPVLAVALSFWLGLLLSFGLQKFFTFGDKRTHHKIVIPQFAAVTLLVLFNFGFTILVTKLLENALPPAVTRTLALGITTVWNFWLYRTRIFKTRDPVVD